MPHKNTAKLKIRKHSFTQERVALGGVPFVSKTMLFAL